MSSNIFTSDLNDGNNKMSKKIFTTIGIEHTVNFINRF